MSPTTQGHRGTGPGASQSSGEQLAAPTAQGFLPGPPQSPRALGTGPGSLVPGGDGTRDITPRWPLGASAQPGPGQDRGATGRVLASHRARGRAQAGGCGAQARAQGGLAGGDCPTAEQQDSSRWPWLGTRAQSTQRTAPRSRSGHEARRRWSRDSNPDCRPRFLASRHAGCAGVSSTRGETQGQVPSCGRF